METITASYMGSVEDEKKGLPTSVWQAEVALRLSKCYSELKKVLEELLK